MPKIILVTSGKGGTGKSTVSQLLGRQLAARGKNALLVELDSGLRGLALMLGLSSFTSCTPGNQTLELSAYWGTNNTPDVTYTETLEYNVTFEKGNGMSSVGYDLNY